VRGNLYDNDKNGYLKVCHWCW